MDRWVLSSQACLFFFRGHLSRQQPPLAEDRHALSVGVNHSQPDDSRGGVSDFEHFRSPPRHLHRLVVHILLTVPSPLVGCALQFRASSRRHTSAKWEQKQTYGAFCCFCWQAEHPAKVAPQVARAARNAARRLQPRGKFQTAPAAATTPTMPSASGSSSQRTRPRRPRSPLRM